MFGWLSSFLQIKIKQKAKNNLTGDNEILRSLHSKRNIKTKTKMFLPICPDQMGRSASTWLRKCDQFSLFQSLSAAEAGPKILNFHVLKKSRVFQRFSKLLLLCDSRQIFGVLSMSLFYYFSQYTWKININGQKSGDAEAAKPALAFENVDFVDDVVIFVIVRINETRKVLYVKVRPRYYINK